MPSPPRAAPECAMSEAGHGRLWRTEGGDGQCRKYFTNRRSAACWKWSVNRLSPYFLTLLTQCIWLCIWCVFARGPNSRVFQCICNLHPADFPSRYLIVYGNLARVFNHIPTSPYSNYKLQDPGVGRRSRAPNLATVGTFCWRLLPSSWSSRSIPTFACCLIVRIIAG